LTDRAELPLGIPSPHLLADLLQGLLHLFHLAAEEDDLLAEFSLHAVPAFTSHTRSFPFTLAVASDSGDFPAFRAFTTDSRHVAFAFAADSGHITLAFAADSGHVTFALAADSGHITLAFAADSGHVTFALAADSGHVALAFATDSGHVTFAIAADSGHVALAFAANSRHVALAFAANSRHVTFTFATNSRHVTFTFATDAGSLAPARGSDALEPFLIALGDVLQLHHLSGREFADSPQQLLVAGGHDDGGCLGALDLLDHHRQVLARFDPLLDQAEELHPKRSSPSGSLLGRRRQGRPRAHQA